jgi:hypothetical protein
MGYTKNTWTDRNVQYPNRYTDELSNVKTFTASPGTITEAGTKVTASRMNNLEGGIESAHKGTHVYGASSGGSDAYSISFSAPFTAYNAGMVINFKADVSNTGAATINVDSLGAKSIKKINPESGKVTIVTGDIIANGIYQLIYDGTDFLMVNKLSAGTYLIDDITLGSASASLDIGTFLGIYDEILLTFFDARITISQTLNRVLARFNDDSGNNYTKDGTASQSYVNIAGLGGSAVSSPRVMSYARIINVADAYKQVIYSTEGIGLGEKIDVWHNNTDKITKITLYPNTDNLDTGMRIIAKGVIWG